MQDLQISGASYSDSVRRENGWAESKKAFMHRSPGPSDYPLPRQSHAKQGHMSLEGLFYFHSQAPLILCSCLILHWIQASCNNIEKCQCKMRL